MTKSVFIFSSPLQFLFTCIISKKINNKKIECYYYNYQKDFSEVYFQILKYIDASFNEINSISNFKIENISLDDELFLPNRYNKKEVDIYIKASSKTKNIYLYEEGFNSYLKHHFNNFEQSDSNFKTSLKNVIKKFLGKPPSLIKLNKFKKIYTTFPIQHLKNQNKWHKIEFLENNLKETQNIEKSCLFLSQSLVEDSFISEKDFIEFLKITLSKLSNTYSTIYFKPHPRNSDKLMKGIYNIDSKIKPLPEEFQDLPAEIFLLKNKVDLYGFSSSTLLYASALLGIESYQCLEELLSFSESDKLKHFYKLVASMFDKHKIKKFTNKN